MLAASLVAITFKAFDISAEKIPFAGLSITFDRGVFEFLLLVVLVYLIVTFSLYYYIDIRNFSRLLHQNTTENWRRGQLGALTNREWRRIAEIIERSGTPQKKPLLGQDFLKHLNSWTAGFPSFPRLLFRVWRSPLPTDGLIGIDDKDRTRKLIIGNSVDDSEDRKLLAHAYQLVRLNNRWFPLRYLFMAARNSPRLWTVRAAYFLRNYCIDGVMPMIVAIFSLLALYDQVDVHSLALLVPRSAYTIPPH